MLISSKVAPSIMYLGNFWFRYLESPTATVMVILHC